MVNVLVYDYELSCKGIALANLVMALDEHPEIKVEIPPKMDRLSLEQKLSSYDILLIHSGIRLQKYVMTELPKKFPNLEIGLLTFLPEDYDEASGKVTLLNLKNTESIVDYVLEASKKIKNK